MPLPVKPTRSTQTEQRYRKRTRDLILACRDKLGLHPHEALDYRQFVGWLVTHKTQWSRPTWRQYKSSVVFVLEQEAELRHDPIASEALEALLPIDVEGCKNSTRKTSGSKLKRFPLKDYRQILNHLEENPVHWGADLERWLISGLLTGLRPIEWRQASMGSAEGEPALIVTNAKATNQRSHGPERTILLGGLEQSERDIIAKHVQRAQEFEKAGSFDQFYHGCAATLARIARLLWPQRKEYVSLYSARHQFSADAKASGLLPEELAALMGHAVDITAARHYGKKTAGFEMIRVRPSQIEVQKVKSVFKANYRGPTNEPKPKMKLPVLQPPSVKDE